MKSYKYGNCVLIHENGAWNVYYNLAFQFSEASMDLCKNRIRKERLKGNFLPPPRTETGIVTSFRVEQAMTSKGIIYVKVRQCSLCGVELYYSVENGKLFFSSACDCVNCYVAPKPRDWQSVADLINNQPNISFRIKLASRFGICL